MQRTWRSRRHLLKAYQFTARTLEVQLQAKDAELDANGSITVELLDEQIMELRLHPGRTLASRRRQWGFMMTGNRGKRFAQEGSSASAPEDRVSERWCERQQCTTCEGGACARVS
jgi:hypothetical protein